ncbi:DUF418 domain-containing protein [Marilutibacter alkalisoli]|uniref:DUF418 domain-containing protein n=1 Tax=Marilutibacter alkalisoli TaxID=2591633 RepID=A0A514BQF3_9GAMM|nr:DUF418 domain-containing protein [Lysobacter alkalisoli]QDH69591.1 DUF418 domain-containing protein [Lysobacter alkalisoli]
MLQPTGANERLGSLDVLRGFALFGIALMNVEFFTSPLVARGDGIDPAASGLDWLADAFVYVFVTGKFWALFALLFGMGFAVMQQRAEAAGRPFAPVYLRRSLGLLAIGFGHAWLLWAGDILLAYSLAALLLLACFARAPTRGLWAWGGGLYYGIVGMVAASALLLGAMEALGVAMDEQVVDAGRLAFREEEIATYSAGSYAAATAFRLRFLLDVFGEMLFFLPMALGVFAFGAWLVRCGVMADPEAHRRLFRGFAFIAWPTGLMLTLISVAIDPAPDLLSEALARPMWASTLQMAGAPLMMLGYFGAFMLFLQRGARWPGVLAPAGRMALTLYLMQSVIGTLVFYGYGLGLWGQVGRTTQILGVVVVFAVQVALAHAWMARFRFGPVEWLWRGLTYLRLPPMWRQPN